MTFLERINLVPPQRCRLCARKENGSKLMTNDDIAKASGLARSTVAKLSKLKSWNSVKAETIEAFTRGCGIDPLAPSRRRDGRLIAAGRLTFIRNSAPSQRRMFDRILNVLGQSDDHPKQTACIEPG